MLQENSLRGEAALGFAAASNAASIIRRRSLGTCHAPVALHRGLAAIEVEKVGAGFTLGS